MQFPSRLLRVSVLAFSLGGFFIAASSSPAQTTTVTTDPVGFTSTSQLAASDTFLSLPLTRPPAFVGTILGISGSTLTVSGSPNWTTNQFVYVAGTQSNHYYVLITTNAVSDPKEGHMYPLTANGSDTLTVDTTSDNLTGLPLNTQLQVIPYWTLGTLYPATNAGVSFTATTATRTIQTEVFIPNYAGVGINTAFSTAYFFSNNVNGTANDIGWRIVGDNSTPHDDDILAPDGFFVVRNQNLAPALPLSIAGAVETKKIAVPLNSIVGSQQDNEVGMIRPIGVTLNNSGLNPSDGSFVATTNTRTLGDELFVFNNAAAALNKAASAAYFYSNNVNGSVNNVGWRLIGDNTTDHGSDILPAGAGFIIRKAATSTAQTVYWTNAPTY